MLSFIKEPRKYLWIGLLASAMLYGGCNSLTESLFLRACSNGDVAQVKLLVEAGANVNLKESRFGETPLMFAANRGQIQVMRYLIEKGADVNALSNNGESVLGRAALTRQIEAIKVLINSGATLEKENNGLILIAASNGDTELLRFLVAKGVNLNVTNDNGDTALHYLIQFNSSVAAIDLLMQSGMKADVKNKFGETPLMMAERYGRTDATLVMSKHSMPK